MLLLQESPILQQEIRDVLTAAMPSHPNISHVRSPFHLLAKHLLAYGQSRLAGETDVFLLFRPS